jgi:hypothetical protein
MNPAVWHCPHRLATLVVGSLSLVLACTSAGRPPRVVPLPEDFRDQPTPVIIGYESAMRAIAKTLATNLGLPLGPVSLQLYADRDSLAAGLVREGFSTLQAQRMADTMEGVGRPGKVMLNETNLALDPWPRRFRLLAHELAHTCEYAAASGLRGSSEQWLREGFAEWAAAEVMESFRLVSVAKERRRAITSLGMHQDLSGLLNLASTDDWVKGHEDRDGPTSYDGAFLAVDLLVQRHGVEAVVRYFRLCAATDDPGAAFQAAFGGPRDSFPGELASYLDELRKN